MLPKTIDEKATNKILVSLIVFGLVFLYLYITLYYHPPEIQISRISKNKIGNYYRVCGIIKNPKNYSKLSLFNLCQNNLCIKVVDFNKNIYPENYSICLTGYVKMYKNKLEIVKVEDYETDYQ